MHQNPLLIGARILDLSRLLPGPFCTHYLAQMGAEVIKIEEPNGGDYCRNISPALFELINGGKKSVTLDLRDAEHKKHFLKLVESADAVIESFRPGVMDRLGCGYEALRAINPRLVYVALTGYGQDGPYAKRPGHDINYRATCGELELQAQAGYLPVARPLPVADLVGSLNGVIGCLAALLGARSSGVGCFVDVSMFDAMQATQVMELAKLQERDQVSEPSGDALFAPMPNYGCFKCSDGRYVALGAMERKFFENFCELVDRKDLLDRKLWDSVDGEPLRSELTALFKTRSRDEWDALLAHHDTCISAVLDLEESLENPQSRARGFVLNPDGRTIMGVPIRFDRRATQVSPVSRLGADNGLLNELG